MRKGVEKVLSKISVKKPYTVLVGVVIVLVLGFMSFRNMSADLLPSMDMPYAIVITTYTGASPEEVETAVSRPVEQSMASITNVKKVSSISNSNYSVVVMEFNDGTDMNGATIDMREKLDTVAAMWDNDSIGNPTIMKINPDMLPIMVAAMDVDGKSATELTQLLETEIKPDIESVEGVASVSASGEISDKIEVIVQPDKLKEVNQKVKDAVEGKFSDAEKEISKNQKKMDSGKKKMENGQKDAAQKLADGAHEIDQNAKKISDGLDTVNATLKELTEKETTLKANLKEIKTGLVQIATAKVTLKTTISQLTEAKSGLEQLQAGIAQLTQQKENIEAMIAAGGDAASLQVQLDAINTQLSVVEQQLTAQGMTKDDISVKLDEVTEGLKKAKKSQKELLKQEKELKSGQKQIVAGLKQIGTAKEKLNATKTKLEKGQISLAEAKKELNKQTILAAVELSVAKVQLNDGETKLNDASNTLKDTKKTAVTGADLEKILTNDMVEGILKAQNFEMPAGYITEDNVSYLVKVGNKIDSREDIENLMLLDMGIDGLEPIYLKDVADVILNNNEDDVYTVVNGNPAVALTVEKATGYSTSDVTKRLNKKFEELEKEVEGLHVSKLMDQGIYIGMVVDSVIQNLLVGGLLAIFILLFFLKDIRPTLIVACSIPLSVVSAVVLMYFSGVTLNVISLSGLALGVGMLVDNSVVVIENIFRMRNEEGATVRRAAIEGARQVTGAIIASTLTTVCVFAPIVFTTGITKQIFVDLALTLAYSLLASLIVSLTLVPAMAQGLLRRDKVRKEGLFHKIQNAYGAVLGKLLHLKAVVLLGSFGMLILFILMAFSRGTTFMPAMASTQMTATISKTKDSKMTDKELQEVANEAISRMLKVDTVETVGAMSGATGTMSMMSSSNTAGISLYLLLDENAKIDNAKVKKEIEEKCSDLDVDMQIQESAMDMSSLMGSGLSLQIKGKNLDKLQKISEDFMNVIQKVKGIDTVTNGLEDSGEELRITVDKEKAMEHSLTVAQVFQQTYAKIAESKSATTISTDTDDYGVYVSNAKDMDMTRNELENIKLTYTDTETQKTKTVKLKKIASISMAASPNSINRENQSRCITVSATIKDGYNASLVGEEVDKVIKKYQMPAGYSYTSTGEDETTAEAMGQVYLLMFVGVLLMYLIMVAQFQSLLSPFIILFTIPLAFTGGFMGLFFSGSEVSVVSMIGFVMLSGIIVNNGIVLVDYINQLRYAGVEKYEAIVEAGRIRLRPILMTAITTVLGLIPMLVTNESGSDMVKPMAIVTVGGLIYGTLLTLFVVPCIYAILNRKKDARMVEAQLDE